MPNKTHQKKCKDEDCFESYKKIKRREKKRSRNATVRRRMSNQRAMRRAIINRRRGVFYTHPPGGNVNRSGSTLPRIVGGAALGGLGAATYMFGRRFRRPGPTGAPESSFIRNLATLSPIVSPDRTSGFMQTLANLSPFTSPLIPSLRDVLARYPSPGSARTTPVKRQLKFN